MDATGSSVFLHSHTASWRVEWACSTVGRMQSTLIIASGGLIGSRATECLDWEGCQVVGVNNNMRLNSFAAPPSNRNQE